MAAFEASATISELKETHMTMYFHDTSAGPNFRLIPVAGIAGKLWTFTQFGTTFVTDDPITETPNRDSAIVGRGQGMYVTSRLGGLNALVLLSVVFTNNKYMAAHWRFTEPVSNSKKLRELSVVSGTGKFRFARGYATFETYLVDAATASSIERCNITVQHYYKKVHVYRSSLEIYYGL